MLGDLSAVCASFLIFGDVTTAGALGIAPFYGQDAATLLLWKIVPMMYRAALPCSVVYEPLLRFPGAESS